jgi:hypothetical protein
MSGGSTEQYRLVCSSAVHYIARTHMITWTTTVVFNSRSWPVITQIVGYIVPSMLITTYVSIAPHHRQSTASLSSLNATPLIEIK